MTSIKDILGKMRRNPKGIRFNQLTKVCDHYLSKAKAYQVRQVLSAIDVVMAKKVDGYTWCSFYTKSILSMVFHHLSGNCLY